MRDRAAAGEGGGGGGGGRKTTHSHPADESTVRPAHSHTKHMQKAVDL